MELANVRQDRGSLPGPRQWNGIPPSLWSLVTGPGAFRLILALAVFVSHVSRLGIGRPAVVIFFMLSGYWVARLYSGWRRGYWTFEASRFLRIWPLLAVTAVLAWIAGQAGLLEQKGNLFSTLGLLGLATRNPDDVIGVCWSLDLELQFYLLLPVALFLFKNAAGYDVRRTILSLSFLWLIGAVLLYFHLLTVLAFLPAFAAGVWIFLGKYRASARAATLSAVLFCAVGFLLWSFPPTKLMVIKAGHPWWLDLAYVTWCLTLVPFVSWNVHQPSPALDRLLGNLSYPFYLVHIPVLKLSAAVLPGLGHAKLLAFVLTLISTWLLFMLVDRPLERWRVRLWRG